MENKNKQNDKQNGGNLGAENSDFLAVLRDFKRACLRVDDVVLEEERVLHDKEEAQNGESCKICSSHPFILHKAGYWIECTDKNCPKMKTVLHLTDKLVNSFHDLGSSGKIYTKVLPEEIYENYFYGSKHWNYFCRDENIGPVILTIKQEFRQSKDFLRIMVRSSSHVIHGMLPVSSISTSPYSLEDVVQFLSKVIGLESQLKPIKMSTAPAELLRIDKVFLKDEYKVGLLYVKEGQTTEEQIFSNQDHSKAFDDFLDLLGDRVRLKGFSEYRGGLDIVNDLTGTHSVHSKNGNKQVMFHVSTLLPFEKKDSQKLQRKRHIGNDIACVVFLEAAHTQFDPECIKSNFLHTFVVVQVDVKTNPNKYTVSVVSRNQVPFYGPSLAEKSTFEKGPELKKWLLNKVINGEVACHKAPNFAKLHQRTRNQLMEDLLESIEKSPGDTREKRDPLPFRDHGRRNQSNRSSVSSQDGLQETFESTDQMIKDFSALLGGKSQVADVRFIVGKSEKKAFLGVKAIMAARSSVFRKLLVEDEASSDSQPKTSPNGTTSPTSPRNVVSSWNITSSKLPGSSRSKKFNLNKYRSPSTGEDDVVLAAFSDLEQGNQKNGKQESNAQQEYVIEEFEPDVFEALIRYLHTGSCHITSSILPGLLCAAHCYEIPEVKQVCVDSIEECLDASMFYTMLQSVDQYTNYPEVQQMIRDKVAVFLTKVEIKELDISAVSLLSDKSFRVILSNLNKVKDISKFKAIVEWSKTWSMKMDVGMVELAKPLISQFVSLSNMSPTDLMEVVQPSGLVPNDQLMVVMATKADPNLNSNFKVT